MPGKHGQRPKIHAVFICANLFQATGSASPHAPCAPPPGNRPDGRLNFGRLRWAGLQCGCAHFRRTLKTWPRTGELHAPMVPSLPSYAAYMQYELCPRARVTAWAPGAPSRPCPLCVRVPACGSVVPCARLARPQHATITHTCMYVNAPLTCRFLRVQRARGALLAIASSCQM